VTRSSGRSFRAVKAAQQGADRLRCCKARDGIELPEGHLLDVMVKRLHEYKRQSLKLLHIVTLYDEMIVRSPSTPRTSPRGPWCSEPRRRPATSWPRRPSRSSTRWAGHGQQPTRRSCRGGCFVAFPANYNVTLAEKLIPAADLSEQISLAGKEASGTGNMKFALNGALTIGTDDGANVEIRRLVGDDNFFLFGHGRARGRRAAGPRLPAGGVLRVRSSTQGRHRPHRQRGTSRSGNRDAVSAFVGDLLTSDRFLALADYGAYLEAQGAGRERHTRTRIEWSRKAILNVARTGFFSVRTGRSAITSTEIWNVKLSTNGS
jgi:starch phosphorylase